MPISLTKKIKCLYHVIGTCMEQVYGCQRNRNYFRSVAHFKGIHSILMYLFCADSKCVHKGMQFGVRENT